jgi:hypothetical protein
MVQARVRITGTGDIATELASLREWLGRESELRGRVVTERAPIGPNQMGAVLDTLAVALGSGGAITVLANSVAVWLRHRRSDVKIEVTAPDGATVSVTADRVPDAATVIETVLRAAHDDQ